MGKDIRNYEFKVNDAQAFVNDKGEIKYKGNRKDQKVLKRLKPLFDAIAKADTSSFSHDKRVDSKKEQDLMNKLHQLLMADGKVDTDELKLGDEFTSSGLTAEAFIDQKLNEAKKKTEPPKDTASLDVAIDQAIEISTELENEPVEVTVPPVEDNATPVVHESNTEPPKVKPTSNRPDSRVSANAFNQAIQNQKMKIQDQKDELTAAFTKEVTVDKGVYLYNVAVRALIDAGIEHPNAKQINECIAQIALVNDISDVNRVPIGTVIKVGYVASAIQPSAVSSPTVGDRPATSATVAPSTITVSEKTPVEILTELEYTCVDKTEGEGENKFDYKEWTKDNSDTMYTAEVEGGVTLAATSLEDLKKAVADYNAAAITAKPDGTEADDAKATRQKTNLENLKKRIELSGGNLDVIKSAIEALRTEGNVDLESPEVQAFVQDLIRTKNVEVLTALLTTENSDGEQEFINDLIKNEETAKTVVSLYTEIRAKENAGEKLTDEEIALKEFYTNKVDNYTLYSIEADEQKGIVAKNLYVPVKASIGETSYFAEIDGDQYYAFDPAILDEFAKDLEKADNDEAKSDVFKKYIQTGDKLFASALACNANKLKASKEDVEALINRNGMFVLSCLSYTPAVVVGKNELADYTVTTKTDGSGKNAFDYKEYTRTKDNVTTTVYTATVGGKEIKADSLDELKQAVADCKDFNNKLAARVETLYTEAAGDPANMSYIEDAFAIIDATDKTDQEKQALKDKILETYFDVATTTEGEGEEAVTTKSYTFKPSRRPTYEEMNNGILLKLSSEMLKAVVKSITVDDMGNGQWSTAVEDGLTGIELYIVSHYAELIKDMDEAEVLDFIQNKICMYKNYYTPFDKVMEMFPDSAELKAELLKHLDYNSSCSDANRVTILQTVLSEDKKSIDTAKLPEGVTVRDLVDKLPSKSDGTEATEGATEVFNAVLAGLGKNDLDHISKMAAKVDDKTKVKEKLTEIISACTAADVDYLVGMASKFADSVNVDAEIKTKLGELLNAAPKDKELVVKIARLTNFSIVPYDVLREIDAQTAEWDDATKAAVFESTINGFKVNNRANLLAKAVEKHLVTKLADDRYQLGDTVYLTDWGFGKDDERTIVMKKVSATGYEHGQKMFKAVDNIGSGDIYDMITGKGNYANYMTTDNISGILQAFKDKSPDEGLMEFLHNEITDYSAGFCSRVPKMLMRRAQELGLQNADSYKALVEYYGAQGESKCANGVPTNGDTFKFTKNEGDKELTEDQAKALDTMIYALLSDVLRQS